MYTGAVSQAIVTHFEKRTEPTEHYVYLIHVEWEDGSKCDIKRSYQQLFKLHIELLDTFPSESRSDRVLPYLPGKSLFGENFFSARRRFTEIADYCDKLIRLPPRIASHRIIAKFFQPTQAESAAIKEADGKAEKDRKSVIERFPVNVTSPMRTQSYKAVAEYTSDTKKQINLKKDEIVDVVQKDRNGWWLVCNAYNDNGWVPGDFLKRTESEKADETQNNDDDANNDEREESPTPQQDEYDVMRWHEAVDDYEARSMSEMSFVVGDVVGVSEKSHDGWWYGKHNNGSEGWVPGNYFGPERVENSEVDDTAPSDGGDKYCTVLYDYESKATKGVDLKKNEKVKVIDDRDLAWWLVEVGGERGWAPSNYLVKNFKPTIPEKSVEVLKSVALVDEIESEIWFKNVTRKEAENFLQSKARNNSFIIRPSRAGGERNPYAVTIFHHSEIINFHIRKRLDGQYATGIYREDEKKFHSVKCLVEFYKNHALVVDGRKINLKDHF